MKPSVSEILTDHNAIIFELMTVCNPPPRVKRSVFDYHPADFDSLRAYLQTINLEEKKSENDDINQDWSDWKDTFLEAVRKFVPVKNLNGRKFLPWITVITTQNAFGPSLSQNLNSVTSQEKFQQK